MAKTKATAGGKATGRARPGGASKAFLAPAKPGRAAAKASPGSFREKTVKGAARLPQALTATYSDALERSRRTGSPFTFVVAVEPRGCLKITSPKPATDAASPTPRDQDDLAQALAAARSRGSLRVAEILSGDDMLSSDEFAELIGTTRATVNTRRKNNQVLGLEGAKRGFRFPEWQVNEDGKPFDALPGLFERLGGPWAVYRFLVQPHSELDGLTGREALRRGKFQLVLAVAENVARGTFA